MTFTQEQIAQALDALPKENRPVMTAIIGQLQAELKTVVESTVRECSQMAHNSHPDDLPFVGGKMLVHFGVDR